MTPMIPVSIATLLQRIVWYESRNEITVKEIAEVTGVHERSVGFYLEDERRPYAEFLIALSHHMITRYGDTRLAQAMLPEGWNVLNSPVALNGSLDDELLAITESEGDIIKALRSRNLSEMNRLAERMMQQAAQLKAEVGRMG